MSRKCETSQKPGKNRITKTLKIILIPDNFQTPAHNINNCLMPAITLLRYVVILKTPGNSFACYRITKTTKVAQTNPAILSL
jgi:hypothetical protein